MVISQEKFIKPTARLTVTWEKLPADYKLEEEPVENTGQPLIAGGLREALELICYITSEMLIASNLGICATLNEELVIKAPDWLYVARVEPLIVPGERRSYTPQIEGDVPSIVMEFLSDTDGGEYSFKRTSPVGKWFFYEQILQVPTYIIFEPASGLLEVYRWRSGHYELELPDPEGRHWLADMGLFLGTWRGEKEGRTGYWLRWWDEAGNLLLWGVELVEQQRQEAEAQRREAEAQRQEAEAQRLRAEEEHQRAEAQRQEAEAQRLRAEKEHQRAEAQRLRADQLAAYLLSQGINPDEIDLS